MCGGRMPLFALFLAAALLFAGSAGAWWDPDWTYRQKITINQNDFNGVLTNFPVLVDINDSSNGVFANAQAGGDDIAFVDSDDSTQLKHEIEDYNTLGGSERLIAWVKIPSMAADADANFYIYYGNAGALDQSDGNNVWDDVNILAIWHMDEKTVDEQNTTDKIQDSTANDYDLDQNGSSYDINGKIGYMQTLDGTNDSFDADSLLLMPPRLEWTISAWIVPQTVAAGANILSQKDCMLER